MKWWKRKEDRYRREEIWMDGKRNKGDVNAFELFKS